MGGGGMTGLYKCVLICSFTLCSMGIIYFAQKRATKD